MKSRRWLKKRHRRERQLLRRLALYQRRRVQAVTTSSGHPLVLEAGAGKLGQLVKVLRQFSPVEAWQVEQRLDPPNDL